MIITVIRAGRCGEARKCQLTREEIILEIEVFSAAVNPA